MTEITLQRLEEVIQEGSKHHKGPRPFVVALDGRCASGKTTIVQHLAQTYGYDVIHMDDFFLPMELRTFDRLQEAGGNVHYERFAEEVLAPLRRGELRQYRKFSCKIMDYQAEPVVLKGSPVLIVEGAYSMHPLFEEYYDISVFVSIDPKSQAERIRVRNGEERLQQFLSKWIPMEEAYVEATKIKEKCQYLVNTIHIA